MTVTQLMADLSQLGIQIEAHGDRLRYHPRSAATREVTDRLKLHKPELLKMLAGDGPCCDRCNNREFDARPALVGPSRVFCAICGAYLGRGDDLLDEQVDPNWADQLFSGSSTQFEPRQRMGSDGSKKPPSNILADPVVICQRCRSVRVLPAVPGCQLGLCYYCWKSTNDTIDR